MAEFSNDGGDGGAYRRLVADIALDHDRAAAEGRNLSRSLRSFSMRGTAGDGDIGAGLRQRKGNGAADAARASGDEGGFAGERFSGHSRAPCSMRHQAKAVLGVR